MALLVLDLVVQVRQMRALEGQRVQVVRLLVALLQAPALVRLLLVSDLKGLQDHPLVAARLHQVLGQRESEQVQGLDQRAQLPVPDLGQRAREALVVAQAHRAQDLDRKVLEALEGAPVPDLGQRDQEALVVAQVHRAQDLDRKAQVDLAVVQAPDSGQRVLEHPRLVAAPLRALDRKDQEALVVAQAQDLDPRVQEHPRLAAAPLRALDRKDQEALVVAQAQDLDPKGPMDLGQKVQADLVAGPVRVLDRKDQADLDPKELVHRPLEAETAPRQALERMAPVALAVDQILVSGLKELVHLPLAVDQAMDLEPKAQKDLVEDLRQVLHPKVPVGLVEELRPVWAIQGCLVVDKTQIPARKRKASNPLGFLFLTLHKFLSSVETVASDIIIIQKLKYQAKRAF